VDLEEVHEAAYRNFERRCIAYGFITAGLIVLWVVLGGLVDESQSQGDIRIGWGFWPLWFVVAGGVDLALRARRLSRPDDDS
jgi:hypothetical protein